ncbi:MAG: hypothetical protein M1823_005931 [Watsoniomyces obsoletus]|nr:MAG: hypothetical protein M1823_005931 [Watsoniomyces obsoletus]
MSLEALLQLLTRAIDTELRVLVCVLDDYLRLRKEMDGLFYTGFLQLSAANRSSQSGGRYGQHYYDHRMQAGLRLYEFQEYFQSEPPYLTGLIHECRSYGLHKGGMGLPYFFGIGSYADRPQPRTKEAAATAGDNNGNDASKDEPTAPEDVLRNAIRWFGVLAPSALKGAQRDFFAIIMDDAVNLANDQISMNFREAEVRRLRKVKKVVELVRTRALEIQGALDLVVMPNVS